MSQLTVEARRENLDRVTAYINRHLEQAGCSETVRMQVELAVEEIFVNIAHYAYHPQSGQAMVRCEVSGSPCAVIIEFLDSGTPYNPLQRAVPDLDQLPEHRPVGGLGVHLTRTLMDGVDYRFEDGKNILTLTKLLDS